jgi:glutamate-1-semialdehyde 2,1-aminomutase
VDGNRYLDIVNNYTSLILGHAHPKVTEALREQAAKGTVFGAPIEVQYRLAGSIAKRFQSVKQLRFCNSGTEATLFAIRLARAFSGKQKIVKMEGGYHGTHDAVEVSVSPDPKKAGQASMPRPVLENRGIPVSVLKDILIAPFNNEEALRRIIEKEGKDIAAVILEPVMGAAGMIPPKPGFLSYVREITQQKRILLIFDEIITFRLSPGGAQAFYDVHADITAFGKCIGGGLPVGAFGASEELMAIFTPGRKGGISHSGTFNGNTLTMVAGLATLDELRPPVYRRLNLLGERFKTKISDALRRAGVRGTVTGEGSLLNLHFHSEEVNDFRGAWSAKSFHRDLYELFHLAMLTRGVFIAPRGLMCLSTPMREKDVDYAAEMMEETLGEIRPYIEEHHRNLIT